MVQMIHHRGCGRQEYLDTVYQLGLKTIVEVGVYNGDFSQALARLPGSKLYGVDCYKVYNDMALGQNTQIIHDLRYELVKEIYKNINATLIRKTSEEAVKDFEDESVDVVYLDADHSYESIKQDIEQWWPKVRKGGILSGHDFQFEYLDSVCRAVVDFMTDRQLTGTIYNADDIWIIYKNC